MKMCLRCLLAITAIFLLSGFETSTEMLKLYIYDPTMSSNYRVEQVEIARGNETAVAYAVADAMDCPKVNVLRWQERKGSYVVDFSLELRDKYATDKREFFLHSFVTTMRFNYGLECSDATVNSYSWFDANKVPPYIMTKDRYMEARDKVEYAPTKKFYYNDNEALDSINKDAMANEIADTLTVLEIYGDSFVDPKELPWDSVLWAAAMATRTVVANPEDEGDPRYIYWQGPEFDSIYRTVGDDYLYLEEHIEKSVYRLFGDDYQMKHRTGDYYKYYPVEGVYCSPSGGLPPLLVTAVLDYRVDWDMVVATVAYAREWGEIMPVDHAHSIPQGCDDEYYLRNLAPKYLAVFGINDDGSLHIRSHHKL